MAGVAAIKPNKGPEWPGPYAKRASASATGSVHRTGLSDHRVL